jgi:hypothetical protein
MEMSYAHGVAIKTFRSGDGKYYVDIVARDDGCFQCYEHKYVEADETDQFSRPYWRPGWMSGIYASADLAERDAIAELSWLREQISN